MAANDHETVIRPRTGWPTFPLYELWRARELAFFLIVRDVKVKYKQSLLGIAWILLKPIVTVTIFTVLFGRIARFPSDGLPYPVFVLAGLLPWTFFAAAYATAAGSVVAAANLINKVHLPRILIPISAALATAVDFLVATSVLAAMLVYYGVVPPAQVVVVPILLVLLLLTALGPGLLFGAANVRYRDVGHMVPFVTQIWFYLTPVIYPVSIIPEAYRHLIYLNPMAGVVEGFRYCVLGQPALNASGILVSLTVSATMLAAGVLYFQRVERHFADVI